MKYFITSNLRDTLNWGLKTILINIFIYLCITMIYFWISTMIWHFLSLRLLKNIEFFPSEQPPRHTISYGLPVLGNRYLQRRKCGQALPPWPAWVLPAATTLPALSQKIMVEMCGVRVLCLMFNELGILS